MIEEYIYKAGIQRAEIIDKTLWAILKTRRPRSFAMLNVLRFRWAWKLFGIRLETRFRGDLYEEYSVFQFDDLLATFSLRQQFTAV